MRSVAGVPQIKSCEQATVSKLIKQVNEALAGLINSQDPACAELTHKYLNSSDPATVEYLKCWSEAGARDNARHPTMPLTAECKRTVTPLGVAALVAYGRAWISAAEERLQAHPLR